MKTKKRFLAVLLAITCFMAMNMSVFAAEPTTSLVPDEVNSEETEPVTPEVTPRTITGYAAGYADSLNGSFTITVTGSASLIGTAKIKAWDFTNNSAVYVTLYRPDGSCAFSDYKLTLEKEMSKVFTGFGPGTYRLCYEIVGSGQGWIYCNLSA
jgi:hypothetical protein